MRLQDSLSAPPLSPLSQAFDETQSAGGGAWNHPLTRRRFLKRTGGATAATFIGWNSLSERARAAEGGSGGSDCSDFWEGYLWKWLDFEDTDLIDRMGHDLSNDINALKSSLETVQELKDALGDAIADGLDPQRQIRSIWEIVKDATGEALESLKDDVEALFNDWIENEVMPAIIEAIEGLSSPLFPKDYYLFQGGASQFNDKLTGPLVTGEGEILNVEVELDAEVDGIGFNLGTTQKLEIKLDGIPLPGFNASGGATEINVNEDCDVPQSATVADRILAVASVSIDVTFLVMSVKMNGEGKRQMGDARVMVYNSAHSNHPTEPPEKPENPPEEPEQ